MHLKLALGKSTKPVKTPWLKEERRMENQFLYSLAQAGKAFYNPSIAHEIQAFMSNRVRLFTPQKSISQNGAYMAEKTDSADTPAPFSSPADKPRGPFQPLNLAVPDHPLTTDESRHLPATRRHNPSLSLPVFPTRLIPIVWTTRDIRAWQYQGLLLNPDGAHGPLGRRLAHLSLRQMRRRDDNFCLIRRIDARAV